jgi:hypothetical protein
MKKKDIQNSIKEIIWMARRYAVNAEEPIFNEAYNIVKATYKDWKEKDDPILKTFYVDGTIEKQNLDFYKAVELIVKFARRYANGRMTFAPITFNEEYDIIRTNFDNKWKEPRDEHIPTFPYAQDGHYEKFKPSFNAIGNRKYVGEINVS